MKKVVAPEKDGVRPRGWPSRDKDYLLSTIRALDMWLALCTSV